MSSPIGVLLTAQNRAESSSTEALEQQKIVHDFENAAEKVQGKGKGRRKGKKGKTDSSRETGAGKGKGKSKAEQGRSQSKAEARKEIETDPPRTTQRRPRRANGRFADSTCSANVGPEKVAPENTNHRAASLLEVVAPMAKTDQSLIISPRRLQRLPRRPQRDKNNGEMSQTPGQRRLLHSPPRRRRSAHIREIAHGAAARFDPAVRNR